MSNKKIKECTLFQFGEEHEDEAFEVFSETNLREQLPELFLQLTPFKPNKPGPKSKFIEETIMSNVFGSVVLTGVELTVFDEDILLGILSAKKQVMANGFYYTTSLRELSSLCGIGWRGAKFDEKGNIRGQSTPKQIIDSIKRLSIGMITINSYKQKKAYNFGIVESFSNPLLDENNEYHYKTGTKDQVQIRLSKEFIFLYNQYKKYTIRLEDRIKIKNLLGKAIYRYLKYISTFKHQGIHKESIAKLINKVNWSLPKKSKDSNYIAWREVKRQLEDANEGLKRVGIIIEIPENLNEESIVVFRKKSFIQASLDI